jgi:hypothetical protein
MDFLVLRQNSATPLLRKAFQEIFKVPQEHLKAEDVTPRNTPTHRFKNGITGSGLLTNTFLVIDPVCINSVLNKDDYCYMITVSLLQKQAFQYLSANT